MSYFLLDMLCIWLEIVRWTWRVAPIEEQLGPFRLVELDPLLLVLHLLRCLGHDVALKLRCFEPRRVVVGSVGCVEVRVIHGYYIRFLLQKEGGRCGIEALPWQQY